MHVMQHAFPLSGYCMKDAFVKDRIPMRCEELAAIELILRRKYKAWSGLGSDRHAHRHYSFSTVGSASWLHRNVVK